MLTRVTTQPAKVTSAAVLLLGIKAGASYLPNSIMKRISPLLQQSALRRSAAVPDATSGAAAHTAGFSRGSDSATQAVASLCSAHFGIAP